MNERVGSPGISIVRIIVGLIELWVLLMVLILGAAFVMSFLGANRDAPFAAWIFDRANNIMAPFAGIFDPIVFTGESVIQTSLLFAILVYVVIGAVLSAIGRRFA